jgi:hypothetical protein
MSAFRILLGPIADGAVLREEGSIISLAEADAAPLLELGIIEPSPEVIEPSPEVIEPAPESEPARVRRAKAWRAED